jgi:hypothetical protein
VTTIQRKLIACCLGVLIASAAWPASDGRGQGTVLPTGGGAALLDTSDAVILLLDHQTGLFQTVKDIPLVDLRNNVVMLAKLATLLKIAVITTASEPNGPNGPVMWRSNSSLRMRNM